MTYDPEDGEVEYHCKTGYELVGEATRECLNTGHWSGEAPACKPIECDPLEDLENGELSYSDVDGDVPLEGSTAIYKCNYGYMLEGDFTRLCLKDGTWSGKDPVCRVIRCPIPEGKNDVELYRLLNRTNRVGSIAKLRCRKGVVVGDDPYMTCTVDGEWTEPKAQCLQPGGSTMPLEELPRIVNRGGVIFGMAVAVIMMVIILVSFYVVKRRRDANKPELPSRQNEPLAPPPRPPPRGKTTLKSAIIELVSRDSSASKYESLNLEGKDEGDAAWKTRSLPTEPGSNEGMRDDLGSNRRTLSYDDPEKLTPRAKENAQQGSEKSAPEEINRVATPAGEYAAVDYDKKRQSRLLKDSEERSLGASPVSGGEQLRELPPIPKEDEEEESRAQSTGTVRSEKSEESEDVSLPIAPSETSEAPTPSPDVVIENQVEGPSASPSSPTSETTPGGRRRRRMTPEQPTPEEVTQPSRRRRSRADHAPSPEAAAAPAGRARAVEPPSPEAAAPTGRTRTRRRTAEREEPESPPPAPAVEEEERPARRTRAAGRYDSPPSTTFQPSSRRRY